MGPVIGTGYRLGRTRAEMGHQAEPDALRVAELPAWCWGCQAKRGGVGEADLKRQAQRAAKALGVGGVSGHQAPGPLPAPQRSTTSGHEPANQFRFKPRD